MTKLTALQVESISKPGRHADGDGLYLRVDAKGNKSWLFRFQLNGKRTNAGLGSYDKKAHSLSSARKVSLEMKRLISQGINPVDERNRLANLKDRKTLELEQDALSKKMTFERCAREWHGRKKAQWSNKKHVTQYINTLIKFAFPYFGNKPVADVDLSDVKQCLDPIWESKTETASRVRSRVENVLSYAIASGYREKANPAVWRGQLDHIYSPPEKIKKLHHQKKGSSGHHKALPYRELPSFYAKLVAQDGVASLALRLCILTATRTGSIRFAKWEQFDLDKRVWTVPADHMKARSEFRVALSLEAVAMLSNLERVDEYLFPGGKIGKPLSNGGMSSVLRRMKVLNATVHGFRSTFRDYIGEETQLEPRIAEYCLAHKVGDATERAYARGDRLDKRFNMMDIWAYHATSEATNVSSSATRV